MMNLRLSNWIIVKRSYEVTPWPTLSSLLDKASGFCFIEMIHRNLSEWRQIKQSKKKEWENRNEKDEEGGGGGKGRGGGG